MALNPFVSLIGRLVARSGRKRGNRQTDRQTDRQNDKTTTVTLSAHARRGLIMAMQKEIWNSYYSMHKKLDQPVHSGRADWFPANPERGIFPPQSNGQALEQVSD